jgi:sodium-dependent dicarboxylate transporter 2/3/5
MTDRRDDTEAAAEAAPAVRVLLVDDDDGFRASLAERLELRGFAVVQAATGEDGVRLLRSDRDIDVVVLDRRLPDGDGKAILGEMKAFRPEVPVIMLTGFGSVGSARQAGELGAFRYLTKPTPVDTLAAALRDAARERAHARARQDLPAVRHGSWRRRLLGSQNLRPAVIVLGLALVLTAMLAPPPGALIDLVARGKAPLSEGAAAAVDDPLAGYPHYRDMPPGASIGDRYRTEHRPFGMEAGDDAAAGTARRALLMIAIIVTAALFWATGAVPIGITAVAVAVVMYFGGVMRPDAIAQAFAKDSVVFIFGVLVFTRVIMATGLNHRIAMLLLKPVRSPALLLFVFLPLFALTCSFISESILIALMMPLFVDLYRRIAKRREAAGDAGDQRQLLVLFALMLCYASNVGGPGSPAAGGRNAVMIGILSDYGQAPTFFDWMAYGLAFVPVAALAVGGYFYLVFRRRLSGVELDAAGLARRASERLGPLTRDEKVTAAVMVMVVALWLFGGERLGMGGPILLGLVVLNVTGVLKWPEIAKIHWDVVFLYAGASAIGKGLADTGGALYLARMFVSALPPGLVDGTAFGGALGATGLPMAVSLLTGVVTNVMSDGATVAAIGPIAVPMAQAAGVHPWAVGFATAFASSFPHMLIIGTPANALAYIMCKDPQTGRQLVTQGDFLKHGAVVFVLSFIVLWGWAFLGYWRWIGFDG